MLHNGVCSDKLDKIFDKKTWYLKCFYMRFSFIIVFVLSFVFILAGYEKIQTVRKECSILPMMIIHIQVRYHLYSGILMDNTMVDEFV